MSTLAPALLARGAPAREASRLAQLLEALARLGRRLTLSLFDGALALGLSRDAWKRAKLRLVELGALVVVSPGSFRRGARAVLEVAPWVSPWVSEASRGETLTQPVVGAPSDPPRSDRPVSRPLICPVTRPVSRPHSRGLPEYQDSASSGTSVQKTTTTTPFGAALVAGSGCGFFETKERETCERRTEGSDLRSLLEELTERFAAVVSSALAALGRVSRDDRPGPRPVAPAAPPAPPSSASETPEQSRILEKAVAAAWEARQELVEQGKAQPVISYQAWSEGVRKVFRAEPEALNEELRKANTRAQRKLEAAMAAKRAAAAREAAKAVLPRLPEASQRLLDRISGPRRGAAS